MAEIEQYTRVRHNAVGEDVAVVGHAAPDLVHLLAELVDNATAFSPPHSTVQVTGRVFDSGAVITVEDDGVGMSAHRLAQANQRLTRPGGAESTVPEQMGLYVVANLGAKHGIHTELRYGTDGGITSVIWVPGRLLTTSVGRITHPPVTRTASGVAALRRSRRDGAGGRTGMWWSREAAAATVASRESEPINGGSIAPIPTAPTAVLPTINDRGLPVRIPMTAHPLSRDVAGGPAPSTRAGGGNSVVDSGVHAAPSPREAVEPERDSAVLSALYRGIRQADETDGAKQVVDQRPVDDTWMER
jgi:hypothetical protein